MRGFGPYADRGQMTENEKKHTPRLALKRAREMRGLSQAELARRVKVDEKTLGRWESGAAHPYPVHREALAKELELTLEELDTLLADNPVRMSPRPWNVPY